MGFEPTTVGLEVRRSIRTELRAPWVALGVYSSIRFIPFDWPVSIGSKSWFLPYRGGIPIATVTVWDGYGSRTRLRSDRRSAERDVEVEHDDHPEDRPEGGDALVSIRVRLGDDLVGDDEQHGAGGEPHRVR